MNPEEINKFINEAAREFQLRIQQKVFDQTTLTDSQKWLITARIINRIFSMFYNVNILNAQTALDEYEKKEKLNEK